MTKQQVPQDVSVVVPLTTEPSDDDLFVLEEALLFAHDAKTHVGALLEVLSGVHPAYKIEAGLYLCNLQHIYVRLKRVVDIVEIVLEPA
jgi:hypothetical protein